MNPTTATMKTIRNTISGNVIAPHAAFFAFSIKSTTPRGKPTTIPEKISNDIPFPTPRSVICSPNHMMNALPVVRVIMVKSRKLQPGFSAKPPFSRPTAMPNDCTELKMTVMYRVHCVIFLRPSSPSFCSLASGS